MWKRDSRSGIGSLPTAVIILVATVMSGCSEGDRSASRDQLSRSVLPNGTVLLLQELEGLPRVGIETFYRVGFLDDPAGQPQAIHFMEHVLSRSATEHHKTGAAWDFVFSRGGTMNAETMPSFTHFDYAVPVEDVGEVLKIELGRLSSLKYEEEVARPEISKCYEEVRAVESAASAPVVKFAMMAANQVWRYDADEVRLKSGLEDLDEASVESLLEQWYRPSNYIIAITGPIDAAKTRALIEHHFGPLEPGPTPSNPPVPWDSIPRIERIPWDSDVKGVFVWYAPPESAYERVVLSLWANELAQRLAADDLVRSVARFVMASSYTWPVGEMPFFVYATLHHDVSADRGVTVMQERTEVVISELLASANPKSIQLIAKDFAALGTFTPAKARQQMQALRQETGFSEQQLLEQTLMGRSLNLGIRELLLGEDVEAMIDRIDALEEDDLRAIIHRVLPSDKKRMTVLVPMEAGQ